MDFSFNSLIKLKRQFFSIQWPNLTHLDNYFPFIVITVNVRPIKEQSSLSSIMNALLLFFSDYFSQPKVCNKVFSCKGTFTDFRLASRRGHIDTRWSSYREVFSLKLKISNSRFVAGSATELWSLETFARRVESIGELCGIASGIWIWSRVTSFAAVLLSGWILNDF